jgi:hypothetical protein
MKTELARVDDAPAETGAVAGALMMREKSEVETRAILARKFPRDEIACFNRVIKSFSRPAMAETAEYSFKRGKGNVTGPSVETAREIKRCFGNIESGIRIVSMSAELVHIRGYAHDLESNNYEEAEDMFRPLIQRKQADDSTRWVTPDERDLRELINRRGSICERNAILRVLPPDVVDSALETAIETLRKKNAGELKADRDDTLRKLAREFDKIGVTVAMLERRLGHELGIASVDELIELRGIGKAILEGQGKREEFFEFEPRADAELAGAGGITEASRIARRMRRSPHADDSPEQVQEHEPIGEPTQLEIG